MRGPENGRIESTIITSKPQKGLTSLSAFCLFFLFHFQFSQAYEDHRFMWSVDSGREKGKRSEGGIILSLVVGIDLYLVVRIYIQGTVK